MKRHNKKTIVLCLLLSIFLCFVFSTIAYSAINGTIKITGDAYARVETDVRITDFRLGASLNATSNYENFGKNHISTEVNLTNTSSKIMYYIEITNYGSNDIGIYDITGLPEGVSYSISNYNLHDKICDDTGKCNSFIKKTIELTLTTTSSYSGSLQLNFDFRTFHKVTYTDIENMGYPTEVIDGGTFKIPFQEDLKRVQLLYNNREILFYKTVTNGQIITLSNITKDIEVKIKARIAKIANGDINEVGSEVCIQDECFYIISKNGSTISMLAKYNLHVGAEILDSSYEIKSIENPTGKQDPSALGVRFDSSGGDIFPFIGLVPFSNEAYWHDETGLKSSYGNSYPVDVYDNNSTIYGYINNYQLYLESLGLTVNKARLLNNEEFQFFEPDFPESEFDNDGNYPFINLTSFWTGVAYNSDSIATAFYNGGSASVFTTEFNSNSYGVRPVIEIDVDEIYVQSGARLVNGSLDTIGSEVCIDEECFYILKNDGTNVSMISKYNLHIGNTYDGTVVPLENPTGIQNEKAIGWFSGRSKTNPIIGSIGFYNYGNIYWSSSVSNYPAYVFNANSPIYSHLQNYKNILINKGANVSNIRLIEVNELVNLGCNISTSSCTSSQYPWLYSTSYWTGSAASSSTVYHVMSNGNLNSNITFPDFNYGSDTLVTETAHEILTGARPVIEMPVSGIH